MLATYWVLCIRWCIIQQSSRYETPQGETGNALLPPLCPSVPPCLPAARERDHAAVPAGGHGASHGGSVRDQLPGLPVLHAALHRAHPRRVHGSVLRRVCVRPSEVELPKEISGTVLVGWWHLLVLLQWPIRHGRLTYVT